MCKKKCAYIYKSPKGILGMWPRFLFMPAKLFVAADEENIKFDNFALYTHKTKKLYKKLSKKLSKKFSFKKINKKYFNFSKFFKIFIVLIP